jgi:multidrug efflux pump subunit AcrB
MFSRIFIERPRFAMVISIVLSIAGLISVFSLPIALYPEITPPEIVVSAGYPGASAEVVARTIGIPLEEQINGVEDMIYMSSSSGNDGQYSLTVSFEVESDRNMDLVKVQNRLAQAEAKLPVEAKQLGGRVRARSTDTLGFMTIPPLKERFPVSRLPTISTVISSLFSFAFTVWVKFPFTVRNSQCAYGLILIVLPRRE